MLSYDTSHRVSFEQLPAAAKLNILALLKAGNFTAAKEVYLQAIEKYLKESPPPK